MENTAHPKQSLFAQTNSIKHGNRDALYLYLAKRKKHTVQLRALSLCLFITKQGPEH